MISRAHFIPFSRFTEDLFHLMFYLFIITCLFSFFSLIVESTRPLQSKSAVRSFIDDEMSTLELSDDDLSDDSLGEEFDDDDFSEISESDFDSEIDSLELNNETFVQAEFDTVESGVRMH